MDNFKDSSSTENTPSWTQGNHDLTGLRSLQIAEIDGLYFIATAIIHYRGRRMLAQSIIPGILNNTDMASLAEYGSVDDQNTINYSETFHELMTQFCEKLYIGKNKVEDKQGN
jgi:protein TIF31